MPMPRNKKLPIQRFEAFFLMPIHLKYALVMLFDAVLMMSALWVAVALRWGSIHFAYGVSGWLTALTTASLSLIIFSRMGFYRAVVRHMGQQAMLTIIHGIAISALVCALSMVIFEAPLPRSSPFLYWGVALFFIGGSRLFVRAIFYISQRNSGAPVAIYGAGASGRQLLNALTNGGEYAPLVFIDDDPSLVGRTIDGIPVFSPKNIDELIGDYAIQHVLLAMPSITRRRRQEIVDALEAYDVSVKTVPSMSDLVAGRSQVQDLKAITIDDILGRDPVPPNVSLLQACVNNKVVMITGAGGSIGSELARQIIRLQPTRLILLDHSEFALYQIESELDAWQKKMDSHIEVSACLANVQDQARIERVCKHYRVQTIYHTAAYKHVPMVEQNIVEGVLNNVFGTLATGKAAVDAGVETFVLISTDKAVRPTNVMGASKRMAELVLQAFAKKYSATRFCMVRFGNVLGSSGSVVPLFTSQIIDGGPVTVTHPDVVRYFMTIPEAVQLVLQAGAMSQGGEVFVLDMGQPVKIVDLAVRMIHLMGHRVKGLDEDGDIDIVYTGLRPGEKLFEELLLGENVSGTQHPMIMCAAEEFLSETDIDLLLGEMRQACDDNNAVVVKKLLCQAVKDYKPHHQMVDHLHRANNNIVEFNEARKK
jgi:FlaA1/EpsC-like NDP-sugar epimerase